MTNLLNTFERFLWAITLLLLLAINVVSAAGQGDDGPAQDTPPDAFTADNPAVPLDEFELILLPMTRTELEVEAGAWRDLLKEKVTEIGAAEIAVKRANTEITRAEDVAEAAQDAELAVEKVEQAADAGEAKEAVQEAQEATKKVREEMEELAESTQGSEVGQAPSDADKQGVVSAADEAKKALEEAKDSAAEVANEPDPETAQDALDAAKGAEQAVEHLQQSVTEKSESEFPDPATSTEALQAATDDLPDKQDKADITTDAAERQAANVEQAKDQLLESVTVLRDERVSLIDRLNLVLDQWELKGGEVTEYRQYVQAVSGVKVDVSDWDAAWATIFGWLTSKEGGLRWAANIGTFVGILLGFYLISWFIKKGVAKGLAVAGNTSTLLTNFVLSMIRRLIVAIGLIVGLSALEVNIGPLLAVIGAAGFAIALALQGTLSNFASGLMILFYRPFDVNDTIDVASVSGTVKSMTLVSTIITTFDNKLMVVPNNTIWQNIITNVTGTHVRRVDMVFGIGYGDDIGKAHRVLTEVVTAHPLVLESPEPTIQLNELADSSVNFIVRPWTKTDDYWSVYWDLLRTVKERFDAEGISIPFPQRDVHLYQVQGHQESQPQPVLAAAGAIVSTAVPTSGELDTPESEKADE